MAVCPAFCLAGAPRDNRHRISHAASHHDGHGGPAVCGPVPMPMPDFIGRGSTFSAGLGWGSCIPSVSAETRPLFSDSSRRNRSTI